MVKIVVVGSASIDLTVISDKRPNAGETVIGKELYFSPGGKGANQAVAAARLGAEVTFIGCVGDDQYGTQIIDNLSKNNINTKYVHKLVNKTTGTAHIVLAERDNSIIVVPGANMSLDQHIIDKSINIIINADIVMVQQEIPLSTIEYLSNKCKDLGVKFLLNPAPIQNTPTSVINNASFIIPNEHEAQAIYPNLTLKEALKENPEKLIITQGKNGALYHDGKSINSVESFNVNAIDTTGAGDAFNAAFAVAIAENQSFSHSIRFANAAAALSVQKLGAQGGMPDRKSVLELLNNE